MMPENKISAKGQRRFSINELGDSGEVGDWFVDEAEGEVCIKMPHRIDEDGNVKGIIISWPYLKALENGAKWTYNDNPDCPTLSPSLHWVGVWHGWLKNGELSSV